MPFHQFPAEVEAQARPANMCGPDIVSTHKASKNVCLLFTWDTHPVIAHTETGFARLLHLPDVNLNRSALRAVFDGITQQIGEDLFETDGIKLSPTGWSTRSGG